MTFEGEFEKVHYPLPLAYLEEPDMQSMLKTFTRLQEQLQMSRSGLAFTDNGAIGSQNIHEFSGAQSERPLNRFNTVQNFFQIE